MYGEVRYPYGEARYRTALVRYRYSRYIRFIHGTVQTKVRYLYGPSTNWYGTDKAQYSGTVLVYRIASLRLGTGPAVVQHGTAQYITVLVLTLQQVGTAVQQQ